MKINRLVAGAVAIATLGTAAGIAAAMETGSASARRLGADVVTSQGHSGGNGFNLESPGDVVSPGFTIDEKSVKANGSGCPAGTVQTQVSPDKTALTVLFSGYTASVSPGDLKNTRKACTTTLPIRVPAGFTWGVTTTTYRGFAEMNDGVKAYQGASYFFQGGQRTSRADSQLVPDESGYWELADQLENMSWAPCNSTANLVITSSLRLQVPDPTGVKGISQASMDTQDTKFDSVNFKPGDMNIGFQFKKC